MLKQKRCILVAMQFGSDTDWKRGNLEARKFEAGNFGIGKIWKQGNLEATSL